MRAIWLLGLAACTTDVMPAVQNHGACPALEGKQFTSTSEHECGLGPTGPSACPWHATFSYGDGTTSRLQWAHSDVEESLRVTCYDTAITSAMPAYAGTFDPVTNTLVWDGFDYAP